MSGDIPLKEHIEGKLHDLDRRITQAIMDRDSRVDLALSAAKEAVAKAEVANERRLDLLNEFRAQQADESRKYALSLLVETQFGAMSERVSRVETGLSALQGRALALAGFGAIFGGAVGAVIVKLLS